jgi:hypothetical protein
MNNLMSKVWIGVVSLIKFFSRLFTLRCAAPASTSFAVIASSCDPKTANCLCIISLPLHFSRRGDSDGWRNDYSADFYHQICVGAEWVLAKFYERALKNESKPALCISNHIKLHRLYASVCRYLASSSLCAAVWRPQKCDPPRMARNCLLASPFHFQGANVCERERDRAGETPHQRKKRREKNCAQRVLSIKLT